MTFAEAKVVADLTLVQQNDCLRHENALLRTELESFRKPPESMSYYFPTSSELHTTTVTTEPTFDGELRLATPDFIPIMPPLPEVAPPSKPVIRAGYIIRPDDQIIALFCTDDAAAECEGSASSPLSQPASTPSEGDDMAEFFKRTNH